MDTRALIKKIEAHAAECATASDVLPFYNAALSDGAVENIYKKRYEELEREEAITDASQLTLSYFLSGILKNVWPDVRKDIYLKRWVELADEEVSARLAECRTVEVAMALCHNAPPGSKAQDVYGALLKKLVEQENTAERVKIEEAIAKAATLKTSAEAAACKAVVEDLLPAQTKVRASREWHVYDERKMELLLKEAPTAAANCKTTEEVLELRDRVHGWGNPVGQIYYPYWVELANLEAPEKAALCSTTQEVKTLFNTAPREENGAKSVYEKRWMELHLEEIKVV